MKKTVLLLAMLSGVYTGVHSEIKLPAVISDNMVLQQQSDVRLWGTARPDSKVTVTPSWDSKAYSITAGKDGDWSVNVATPQAGLLDTLARNEGRIVTVDTLCEALWGDNPFGYV